MSDRFSFCIVFVGDIYFDCRTPASEANNDSQHNQLPRHLAASGRQYFKSNRILWLIPGVIRLTVAEHLWFYSQLKGQARSGKEVEEELEEESDKMISDLGIPHKRDEMSKNLSGGMQRKLSIACAFVGGSKWVLNCACL